MNEAAPLTIKLLKQSCESSVALNSTLVNRSKICTLWILPRSTYGWLAHSGLKVNLDSVFRASSLAIATKLFLLLHRCL